jgi:hypothetical protein
MGTIHEIVQKVRIIEKGGSLHRGHEENIVVTLLRV